MKARAEVKFSGKVQGVYFRAYTKRFADELGVVGFVKNMPDGSVYAVFEGEKELIDEVVRKLREEHPYARVNSIEIKWSSFRDEFDEFKILYD
ncbi:MAG: acylphosphatase [Methanomassiliicoccales archaeon]|jgi:acylphosphatase|nr:acylphosphatase [Methanomassiliicoccales archaeon]